MRVVVFLLLSLSSAFSFQNSVGLAYLYSNSIYTKQSDTSTVFPALFYQVNNFYFRGIEIGYKYNSSISFILRPNFNTREIKGLEDRKMALNGGVKYSQDLSKFKINYTVTHDISNTHNGTQASIKLAKTFINFPFITTTSAGVEYDDKKIANYYFGVEENNIYPTYTTKGTISGVASIMNIYNINKKYSVFTLLSNKFLSNDIKNSPIVDSSNKSMLLVSLLYKF